MVQTPCEPLIIMNNSDQTIAAQKAKEILKLEPDNPTALEIIQNALRSAMSALDKLDQSLKNFDKLEDDLKALRYQVQFLNNKLL